MQLSQPLERIASCCGNPAAQSGFANITNNINRAISSARGSSSIQRPSSVQLLSSSGALTGTDVFDRTTNSFADFYALRLNNAFRAQTVVVGAITSGFSPILGIYDYGTGQLVALNMDYNNIRRTALQFTAQAGHTYVAVVESKQAFTRGSYAIIQAT
jgi:hypothetical protein